MKSQMDALELRVPHVFRPRRGAAFLESGASQGRALPGQVRLAASLLYFAHCLESEANVQVVASPSSSSHPFASALQVA